MLKHVVEEVILKNGAKGLFIDVPDASVMSLRVHFRAGDIYGPSEEKWETAHIMEHLSLGANKRYKTSKMFTKELQKNGARTNAQTSQADMIYEGDCADFEWERFVELFVSGISQPLFLEEEFKAECGNVYEELLMRGNNHGATLALCMAKKYGFAMKPWKERAELMQNVTVQDIRNHYENTHFAQNMRFTIAGKLAGRKKKLIAMLEAMPLPVKRDTSRFTLPVEKPQPFDEPLFIHNPTVENAYFYIDTYALSEISLEEQYALGLLGTIYTDLLYSRIQGELRERGLAYYFSSGQDKSPGNSSWWFGSQVSEANLLPVLEVFTREISAIKRGEILDKDIEEAKLNQLGGFQMAAQTVGSITNGYAYRYFYDETVNDVYTKFEQRLQKIDKQQLVSIAEKMFADKVWGLGFLGTISEESRVRALNSISGLW
jgi:predicted Zn-dependent peptidase